MKKIIVSLLLILCCGLCFAGCKETLPENYYKVAGEQMEAYFTGEDFTKSINMNFSAELESLMSKEYGSEYAELKNIYAPLYEQTIFCATKYANVFVKGVIPANESEKLKDYFRNINKCLDSLKKEINQFNINRSNYESYITFSDNSTVAQSEIEKSRLKRFKLDYLSLLSKAYDLSENVFKAYNEGYNSMVNFEENSSNIFEENSYLIEINLKLALNASNLQLTNSAIKTLRVYLNKDVDNEYDKLWNSSVDFFENNVKRAYSMTEDDFTKLDAENIYNKLKSWSGVYNIFVEDAKTYNDIVSNIKLDILKKYGYNAKEYAIATKDKTNESKANFFMNYYKNIEQLNNYSLRLINN